MTGWKVWLLSLGLVNRRVVVDPEDRVIRVFDHVLWVFPRTRRYRFDQIRAISYGYSDVVAFGGFNLVRDSYDLFTVGLKLHDESDPYRHLFRFWGDGTFVNDGPTPNWWYWQEYLWDAEGTQESESRHFVDLLFRMTKTTIEPL